MHQNGTYWTHLFDMSNPFKTELEIRAPGSVTVLYQLRYPRQTIRNVLVVSLLFQRAVLLSGIPRRAKSRHFQGHI